MSKEKLQLTVVIILLTCLTLVVGHDYMNRRAELNRDITQIEGK